MRTQYIANYAIDFINDNPAPHKYTSYEFISEGVVVSLDMDIHPKTFFFRLRKINGSLSGIRGNTYGRLYYDFNLSEMYAGTGTDQEIVDWTKKVMCEAASVIMEEWKAKQNA